MQKRPVFTLLLLLLCLTGFAQRPSGGPGGGPGGERPGKVKLSGTILDADTGLPLEYATVSIFAQRDSSLVTGAMSDLEGKFSVDCRPGRMFAKVEFISYESATIESIVVRPDAGPVDLGNISLSVSANALEEVEVRAERSQLQLSLDKKIFTVGKDLANTGGSAQDILNNVPSVNVGVEGEVSLRGSENVRMLIDGKPSGLVGSGDANGLRSIPANMIEKVEVITNPSSKYEAEGIAGIINIVLKKDNRKGLNGSFDFAVGVPAEYSVGINLNYRKNKFNFFTTVGMRYNTNPGGGFQETTFFRNDSTFNYRIDNDRQRAGLGSNFRFGADYNFTPKDVLTAALLYKIGDDNNDALIEYYDYHPNSWTDLDLYTARTDDEFEDEENLEYNLSYTKTFTGRKHKLVADVRFSDRTETEGSDLTEKYSDANGNPTGVPNLLQRSRNSEGNQSWIATLDYVQPIGEKGKVETGLRGQFRDITNDYKVDEQVDSEWKPLADFTNNFLYDENILAAYVQAGNENERFGYQVGLRLENTDLNTRFVDNSQNNDRDYLNLFPSAAFTYKLKEGQSLQLSYSRRIRRPGFWELNPFFTFTNPRSFWSGNPNLDPEYTNSYEVSYIRYFEKATFNASVYHRHTDGVINRISLSDEFGLIFTQPENVGTRNSYGVELVGSATINSWWKVDANIDLFQSELNGVISDVERDNTFRSMRARLSSNLTIAKQIDWQAQFQFRGPAENLQGTRKAILVLNTGLSKDILKKKGTLTLSARDLFNSRKRVYTRTQDNFYSEGEFQWRSRQITLSLNYRLNQKKKRGRRGGGYQGGEQGEF